MRLVNWILDKVVGGLMNLAEMNRSGRYKELMGEHYPRKAEKR